ncbi:MAG: alpha/beta hydrolase [Oscillospiraceae bacterium]|jgi:acetyl esterase/lipase|nr:alpha/beta hydrolase [Oscillospiraceae bacterium]
MWGLIYAGAFLAAFAVSAALKMTADPFGGKYTAAWDSTVGSVYTDLPYGDGEANKFDLYVPADRGRESYGLVVYLHAGGFTSGDKSGDHEILKWLCAKGYVAAGINYTLFSGEHPEANVYTQSVEIRDSIPFVLAEAEKLGYPIDRMAVSGGSAGHALAMLYAYRDADTSPVPVKMTFGAVGPSCFNLEDWINMGADPSQLNAVDPEGDYSGMAGLFSAMAGKEITADMLASGAYLEAVKDISAAMWVDERSAPSVHAYGAWDRMQAFSASKRLDAALTRHGVPHEYIVFPHSGHGLQNDNAQYALYMEKVEEYLERYMG